MPDFREYEDVVFIAGQTFQSEFGTHLAGTEVEEAKEFHNLQVLVDAKFLYPIAPEGGYAYLPPHLFNHIDVKEATMAKLKGALNPNPDHFQDGRKPEPMLLAEREARQKLDELSGTTEAAKKVQEQARESAKHKYVQLQTVDANPAVSDKGGDKTKLYMGKQEAWELIQEQGDAASEAQQSEPPKEVSEPVNLRETNKKEEKLKDEENPDLAASKKPAEKTDNVVDPVGKQPANVSDTGSVSVTERARSTAKKKESDK